jgi:Rad3-related DNA helicase
MRRRLISALALLLFAASPASAYLVEVTTSVTVADADDRDVVRQALMAAVDDVLKQAIAFTPTLVVLTSATLVNTRLYIRLLLADEDGERTYDELKTPGDTTTPEIKL